MQYIRMIYHHSKSNSILKYIRELLIDIGFTIYEFKYMNKKCYVRVLQFMQAVQKINHAKKS
jgi:hypothetical protein